MRDACSPLHYRTIDRIPLAWTRTHCAMVDVQVGTEPRSEISDPVSYQLSKDSS